MKKDIMLTQLHFLLTYMCTLACEHCFVCSSPAAEGTFTLTQISQLLDQCRATGTVDTVYFEGGEPFLFYPLLVGGVREARKRGFAVGIVTNGYFATSGENARLFLEPLAELGLSDLSISDDVFHSGERSDNPARCAFAAANEMGLPASILALEPGASGPDTPGSPREEKMGVITGGSIMFRGRAAETLSRFAPAHDWRDFTRCPYEDLIDPGRVHVDPWGNIQICQGISIGNVWQLPLQDIMAQYSAFAHPVCGPLVQGGPARLADDLGYLPPHGVADACHLCFLARKHAKRKLPGILEPDQVYCDE